MLSRLCVTMRLSERFVPVSHIEIFTDILTGNQVMGGSAYIHMVNQDGDFLIRSERAAVQEESETLFGEPYLNPDQYSDIEEKLHAGEEARFSFEYNGESYRTLLEPVGINGWYLFCVNSVAGEQRDRIFYRESRGGDIYRCFISVYVLAAVFLQINEEERRRPVSPCIL